MPCHRGKTSRFKFAMWFLYTICYGALPAASVPDSFPFERGSCHTVHEQRFLFCQSIRAYILNRKNTFYFHLLQKKFSLGKAFSFF